MREPKIYVYDLLLLIENNNGKTVNEIKEMYLKDEPDCITAKKVCFDDDIKHLQDVGCISIIDNVINFISWS